METTAPRYLRFLRSLILTGAASAVPLAAGWAYAIVAFTQFAKYLPGNVAHHVGRVVVARPLGGNLARLSLSVVYENLLTALAAAHLTAVLLVMHPVPALEPYLPTPWRPWLLLAATAGAGLGFLLLRFMVLEVQRMRGTPVEAANPPSSSPTARPAPRTTSTSSGGRSGWWPGPSPLPGSTWRTKTSFGHTFKLSGWPKHG